MARCEGPCVLHNVRSEGPGERRERSLADAFVEMADTLVDDYDVLDFLHGLAGHCVDLLDVDAAGLMLADRDGVLRVAASSTEQVRLLELFELQNEEGPCLECFGSGSPVASDDLVEETTPRWPRFGPEATSAGFRSVVALPLRLREETIGALNLFRVQPGRCSTGTNRWRGRSRTWRRSASCRSAAPGVVRCWPSSCSGPDQPDRHRAGQGGHRGAAGRARRCRLRADARLCAKPRGAAVPGRRASCGPGARPAAGHLARCAAEGPGRGVEEVVHRRVHFDPFVVDLSLTPDPVFSLAADSGRSDDGVRGPAP